jgi:predicted nucleic acid-binding protein
MYLLDTNVLSELVKARPNAWLAQRFLATGNDLLFTSVICLEEIRFGASAGSPGNKFWERTEHLILPQVAVLSLDAATAIHAGELRAQWKSAGTPINYADGLIAATALHHGLILVTRNVRHFAHITGLTTENWFEPPPAAGSGGVY